VIVLSRQLRGRNGGDVLAILTTGNNVDILANMPAELIHRFRDVTAEGHLIEMVVWRVPAPVPPATHGLKYRLAYIVNGKRVVGFDNERGKGDHCHLDGQERDYLFVSLDQLIEDFIREVESRRPS
jgi:hypothetical protein